MGVGSQTQHREGSGRFPRKAGVLETVSGWNPPFSFCSQGSWEDSSGAASLSHLICSVGREHQAPASSGLLGGLDEMMPVHHLKHGAQYGQPLPLRTELEERLTEEGVTM